MGAEVMHNFRNVANRSLGPAKTYDLLDEIIVEWAIKDADVVMSAQFAQKCLQRVLYVIGVSEKNQVRGFSQCLKILGECQKPAGLRLGFF